MARLDLPDIQGVVLRLYRMPVIRYLLLRVNDAAAARSVLGRLATASDTDGLRITTADEWRVATPGPLDEPKASPPAGPDYCLNVGITWAGLDALGVTGRIPAIPNGPFTAFVEGAAARAPNAGDTGANGPESWVGGFGSGADHVMVTIYTASPDQRDAYSARLTAALTAGNAFEELWHQDGGAIKFEEHDGQMVPLPVVHFGYRDGMTATPPIVGGPEPVPADHQQPCEPWLFVLADDAGNYQLPHPAEFWRNGSFGVFKLLEQDVAGFEDFLQSNKGRIDPELLAAKVMGRWRNGVPLALSPESATPAAGLTEEQLNDFEYVNADRSGDPRGTACPVGAHIRRVNPRGQPVAGQGTPGGSNNTHRLIRRGIPYGPWYDPAAPDDGIERGLLGYFINTYIENQYEFVTRQWTGSGEFAGRVRLDPKSKDPLIGMNDPADSVFDIPQPSGPPLKLTGFTRFTTTRAVAYCFLPSMTALHWISSIR
jgi:deferrochelatase/peroxidase EfeB